MSSSLWLEYHPFSPVDTALPGGSVKVKVKQARYRPGVAQRVLR